MATSRPITAEDIAANAQPVIDALKESIPAADIAKVEAWYKRYAKGIVVVLGSAATVALQYVPVDSQVGHIATGVVLAVTVVGVIGLKNAPAPAK